MKKIFAANWKLFKSPQQTRQFFRDFKEVSSSITDEVVFFPSAISLEAASQELENTRIKFGAQNCYFQGSGAFTGENSAEVVKELGGSYVLIGHSERRKIFGETDSVIADKVAFTQSLGLKAMLCIGETLEEREAKHTFRVLENQLQWGLAKADKSLEVVVAYEPVWAIGTGKVASPEQVAETHADVFNILHFMGFGASPILYGGSVKAENATGLIQQPHVNGFLVGGASLEVSSFLNICKA